MAGHILGDVSTQKCLPRFTNGYFLERDCWIDCRVPGMIEIDQTAEIGWEVKMVAMSHDINPGMFGRLVGRRIKIGPKAFVAGFALLYNCVIGEGSIVAVGAVVRSRIVPPWTMVEGNPARAFKRFDVASKKWVSIPPEDLKPYNPGMPP